ncbi:MAG TPA: hypothetical protein VFT21_06760 [Gemmatimonadaceae bacterium]|nr:hypothetical protein [Gemmatimonadaceae bacterium]
MSLSTATACRLGTEPDERIKLRFEGTVLADAKPIEGAKVRINGTLFVWTLPVAEAVTDSNGKYVLEMESSCQRGTDLYSSPGNSLMLVASLAGYEDLSSVNMNRTLYCTSDVQRVDFPLRKL